MKVTIHGASDDLIEVDGDLSEEFNGNLDRDEHAYLAFSDGTLLSMTYDAGGMWRINRVAQGSASYTKREATDPSDDYSDRVTLEGEALTWVVCGREQARSKRKQAVSIGR